MMCLHLDHRFVQNANRILNFNHTPLRPYTREFPLIAKKGRSKRQLKKLNVSIYSQWRNPFHSMSNWHECRCSNIYMYAILVSSFGWLVGLFICFRDYCRKITFVNGTTHNESTSLETLLPQFRLWSLWCLTLFLDAIKYCSIWPIFSSIDH